MIHAPKAQLMASSPYNMFLTEKLVSTNIQLLVLTNFLVLSSIMNQEDEIMFKVKDLMKLKNFGVFAGGVLFGTAGIAVLSSKDAKNLYTQCTAAVLRGKDGVMKTAMTLKENCGDIYADAKDINDKRYEAAAAARLEEAEALVEESKKASVKEEA